MEGNKVLTCCRTSQSSAWGMSWMEGIHHKSSLYDLNKWFSLGMLSTTFISSTEKTLCTLLCDHLWCSCWQHGLGDLPLLAYCWHYREVTQGVWEVVLYSESHQDLYSKEVRWIITKQLRDALWSAVKIPSLQATLLQCNQLGDLSQKKSIGVEVLWCRIICIGTGHCSRWIKLRWKCNS